MSGSRDRPPSTMGVLYFLIFFGQCFALFPVTGIGGDDHATVKFTWTSNRALFSAFYLMMQMINFGFCVVRQARSNLFLTFGNIPNFYVSTVYFASIIAETMIFFDIAKKWPTLMRKWGDVDRRMETYPVIDVRKKLKVVSCCVICLAAVEHALFIGHRIYDNNTLEGYFLDSYDQIFDFLPYSIYLGIFMQLLNVYIAIAWNYMDLLIMAIGIVISARFLQINKKIEAMIKYRMTDELRWKRVREDFVQLNTLCKAVDRVFANLVVLSFASNLFVVLVQFMHTVQPSVDDLISKAYFIFSFAFLIVRTISVCLFASGIHTEQQRVLTILSSLPTGVYNMEIERLSLQVKTDPAYLSGRQIFVINRALVLNIAGAIVTYELVLIQIIESSKS